MRNRENRKLIVIVSMLCVLTVSVLILGYFIKKKDNSFLESIIPGSFKADESQTKRSSKILIQTDSAVERVEIATGKRERASALENEDFSDLEGLPKLGENGKESVEQSFVLVSQDHAKAVVVVSVFDQTALPSAFDGTQPLLRSAEYTCSTAEKKCTESILLSQKYQNLNPNLQKQYGPLWWSKWDSTKNLLYGNLSGEGVGNASPVYACNTQSKSCQKTAGYDSLNEKEIPAVVPSGAYSPTLEKFVMINQYDKPNDETGKRWELLYYRSDDLTLPSLKYDISLAIDSSENVFYDSVRAVAWSQDEKKIAFSTSHKIMMLDFMTGKLQLVYDAPLDEDDGYLFDGSELIYSEDGKYIVFADAEDKVVGEGSEEEQEVEVINVIKKIDLENNNEVTELLRGSDLSLKL